MSERPQLRSISVVILMAAIASGGVCSAQAQSAEEFYKGKDVRILIGADVGGGYGLYAQLAARHLRKHIPGQPNLILQSMPGAGGNVALNYSYNVAPKDGSLLHLVHAEVLSETLLTEGVKFNAQGYQYIGRIADADAVVLSTKASGTRTLEDARKRETTVGVTGFANVFALSALMLNRTTGTKFKIIAGYKGSADISLALLRGEVDSSGMTLTAAITTHGDKVKSGDLLPVVVVASKRLAFYPDVPAITEFGSAADKILMEIYASSGTIGRALAFPPGVPADRVAALRGAFARMLDDAEFKAEAPKSGTPINPITGEALGAYIAQVMKSPSTDVDAARRLHKELLAGNK